MPKSTPLAPEAKCVTFAELFADGREFKIPDYQRAYAWEDGEVKDLLEDIDRLALMREDDDGVSHVMGMITCHRSSDNRKPYRVVDGQQRLTTLALIHAELSRRINSESFLFTKNGNVRLIPQALDENFFYATLRGKIGVFQTQGQRNYAAAARTIRQWIEDNSRAPEALKGLVEGGLSLILFTLRDEADVARVFEAINNRGRKVTQLDLVKNHIIHLVHIKRWQGNVQGVWSKISMHLAKLDINDDEADRVLRAVVTAQFYPGKRKAGETDANIIARKLPVFGKAGEGEREEFEKFLGFIGNAFDTYSELLNANSTSTPRTRALTYLRHHGTLTSVLPIVLAHEYLSACNEGAGDATVLATVEKVNFRLYGLRGASKRVDSHDVKLANLAYNYFNGDISPDMLKKELMALVKSEQPKPEVNIVSALTLDDGDTFDFYNQGMRKWLRYFLARWEESLLTNQSFDFGKLVGSGPKSNDKLEVEHIWAQKQADISVKEYNGGQLIRRLGNLMLMPKGMNIVISKHLPEIKAEKISDMKIIKLQQNVDLDNYVRKAKFFADYLEAEKAEAFGEVNKPQAKTIEKCRNVVMTKVLCDLREEEMIRFALDAWKLDGEELVGRFIGVHSFAYDGSTYRHDREGLSTKLKQNYLLIDALSSALARRHKARVALLLPR
jgi:hypothetical protein